LPSFPTRRSSDLHILRRHETRGNPAAHTRSFSFCSNVWHDAANCHLSLQLHGVLLETITCTASSCITAVPRRLLVYQPTWQKRVGNVNRLRRACRLGGRKQKSERRPEYLRGPGVAASFNTPLAY